MLTQYRPVQYNKDYKYNAPAHNGWEAFSSALNVFAIIFSTRIKFKTFPFSLTQASVFITFPVHHLRNENIRINVDNSSARWIMLCTYTAMAVSVPVLRIRFDSYNIQHIFYPHNVSNDGVLNVSPVTVSRTSWQPWRPLRAQCGRLGSLEYQEGRGGGGR